MSASDENAQTPCISVGNMLQIEDEWIQVVGVDTATNILTVLRGRNGSTAAIHAKDTPISTWSVQPEIQRAAARWLGYWYARRGAYETVKNDLSNARTLTYPEGVPLEIMQIIDNTRDWRIAAV